MTAYGDREPGVSANPRGVAAERRRWALVVAVLLLVILVLLVALRRPTTAGSVIVDVRNGPTLISTQVVPLH